MDEQTKISQINNKHRIRATRKTIGFFILSLMLIIGFVFAKHKPFTKSVPLATNKIPESVINAVRFPTYYPATLPAGYQLSKAEAQNTIVNLYYQYAGSKRLIITEQPKPLNIEEVTKTKDFNTSVGPAYLASLNGRNVGFVRTDKTLIILTSDSTIDANDLEQLAMSLKPAN